MSIIETVVFFVLCWWMVFYLTLPFGVQREDAPIKGQATSAPKNPMIKRKMLISSVATIIITLIFKWYMG
jgi:predicted secreted protein